MYSFQSHAQAAIAKAQPYLPDIERFLAVLKTEGMTPSESVIACNVIAGLTPYEAKEAVFFSPSWAFQRTQTEALHDQLEALIRPTD